MTIPAAPSGPSGVASWLTVFADDFDGPGLDTAVWFPGGVPTGTSSPYTAGFNATGTPPTPAGNFQIYNSALVSVASSILTLTCQAVPGGATITASPTVGGTGTVYHYESGCITTNPNSAFGISQPGVLFQPNTRTVVEFYAKIPPAGVGIWPALWTSSYGAWTYEVDLAELYDSDTQPQQNIHFITPGSGSPTNNNQSGPNVATVSNLSTAFHRFTADINVDGAGRVDFYLDGVFLVSYTEPGYATAEMLLIANVALASASPTNLPATMQIDYVAVYQPETPLTSVVVAPLDANNHLAPQVRDDVSALFTSAQSTGSLVNGRTHVFNLTGGAINQSLPTAPTVGTTYTFKRLDTVTADTFTLTAGGSDTIEQGSFGVASITVGPGRAVTVVYSTGFWTVVTGNLTTTGVTTITDVRYRGKYGINVTDFLIDENGADYTGSSDSTTAFTACVTKAAATIAAGATESYIELSSGAYKLSGGNLATTNSLIGVVGPGQQACTILGQGTGTLIKRTQTGNWFTSGGSTQTTPAAKMSGFTLDGSAMGTSSACAGILDIDVMRGNYEDLAFQSFLGPIVTTAASLAKTAGLWQYNATYWAERCVGRRLNFYNNSVHHLQDGGTSTGPASFDYSWFHEVSIQLHLNQIGRYVINSANCAGGSYELVTNALMSTTGPAYLIAIGIIGSGSDSSNVLDGFYSISGETDGSGTVIYDINVAAVAGWIGHGVWALSSGGTAFTTPSGMVFADTVMSGNVQSPWAIRRLGSIVGVAGAISGSHGTWASNQTTRYGFMLASSQGTAPTIPVTLYSSVGVPTFTANNSGDWCVRQDSTTAGSRWYQASGSPASTWTASSV